MAPQTVSFDQFRFVADDQGVGWLHVPTGRRLPIVSGGDGPNDKSKGAKGKQAAKDEPDEPASFEIPEDISGLDDDELKALTDKAVDALDRMLDAAHVDGAPAPTPDQVQVAKDLAGAIKDMKAERGSRDEDAENRRREFEEAIAEVRPAQDQVEDGTGQQAEGEGEGSDDGGQPAGKEAEQPAETPAEGELVDANASRRGALKVEVVPRKATMNPSLAAIAANQPDPGLNDQRPDIEITAAADVPMFSNGEPIPTLDDLVRAMTARASALGIGNGTPHFVPLAKIKRQFPLVVDAENMTPAQQKAAWDEMLADRAGGSPSVQANMEALVAAGGWCAPSEIRYDFFDVSGVSGLVDLPTFGVRRGGLRWPTSLSLFDFFALSGAPASGLPSNATMPWEWTETDDILAATGATPTKTCLRPPCPGYNEERLRVFGLCVLAGNLTEDAFPELIRHFVGLTVTAHARVINRRMLLLMATASTATTPTVAGETAVNAWLGGLSLNATDYRAKFGMAENAVLEIVAPSWAREVLRSDLAKKNGLDRLDAADAYLMSLFDVRNLRVQWVQDWQTRLASGIAPNGGGIPTNWPTTATAMMFAPGTFGRGNGMTLDLGVVRDSVLNADNDHTAAWSEEATMLAKFGNESRLITLNTVAGGVTGQQAALTGA